MIAAARGWRSVSRAEPCPICGRDHNCSFTPDGAGVVCGREPSDQPARDGRYFHWLGEPRRAAAAAPTPITAGRAPADPAALDRAYRALLRRLDLAAADRDELLGPRRQLDAAAIARHGYRTLPGRGRAAIARELLDELGAAALERVPGFFVHKGRYWTLAGRGGALVIPVRDADGRIVGLRLRVADGAPGRKAYHWLSSGKDHHGRPRPGGTPATARVHVARPAQLVDRGRVYVTEGELKADIAADRLGAVVLSVPGFTAWSSPSSGFLEAIDALVRELGASAVVLALDQDAKPTTNGQARAAERAMGKQLLAAGHRVEDATWSSADGKGLDDLLLGGRAPAIRPFAAALEVEGRIVTLLHSQVADRLSFAARPLRPLAEARAELRRLVDQRRAAHRETGAAGVAVFADAPGVGKTRAHLAAWVEDLQAGRWPAGRRVAYLARTKEQIAEHLAPGGVLAPVREHVFRLDGRNEENCRHLEAIRRAGQRRQIPAATICGSQPYPCPHAETVLDPATGRLERAGWCPQHGYLAGKREMARYSIVVAAAPALLNGSDELAAFDEIVLDDVGVEPFVERAELRIEDVAEWEAGVDRTGLAQSEGREGEARDWSSLFRVLRQALASAEPAGRNAVPALRGAAAMLGVDLDRLLGRLEGCMPGQLGRYAFETGYERAGAGEADGFPTLPLVLARRLVLELVAEQDVGDGDRSALTILVDGAPLLRAVLPRRHALGILDGSRGRDDEAAPLVSILDGTPSPLLFALLPDAERVRIDVAEPTHVTQVHDRLFRGKDLADPDRGGPRMVDQVDRLVAAAVARHRAGRPVVLCPKAVDPDEASNYGPDGTPLRRLLARPAGARFGHWFADERALNAYTDADLVVLVGLPLEPVDQVRQLARAVHRFDPTPQDGSATDLRPYDWVGADGRIKARRCTVDPDPLVRALGEAHHAAAIAQAIGRGRPVLRPADAPLPVVLLGGMPVAGLRVDELVTAADYLGGALGDPADGDAAALDRLEDRLREGIHLDERREMRASQLDAGRAARNAAAAAAADARADAAIAALVARGEPVSFRAVAAEAGGLGTRVVLRRLRAWRSSPCSLDRMSETCAPESMATSAPATPRWRLDLVLADLRPLLEAARAAAIDLGAVGRRP